MVKYSPSSAKTYRFCSKKYYFNWVSQKKQGWRKSHDHPWYKVYSLKRVKHSNEWAGLLYHQIISNILFQIQRREEVDLKSFRQLAQDVADIQFNYSKNKKFIGAIESKAPQHEGVSCFLALFEHVYDLPDGNILNNIQQKLDAWLTNTFAWSRWDNLIELIQNARFVYIEPENLWYSIGGAKISARMDVGIETRDRKFIIYDWKCYSDDIRFAEQNEKSFRHQLLTYALWPTLKENYRIPIQDVATCVYYPSLDRTLDFTFQEEDVWDYEIKVEQWVRFHEEVFTEISDVDFEDLSGPYDPQRSCPWCEFKQICGEEIAWHQLK